MDLNDDHEQLDDHELLGGVRHASDHSRVPLIFNILFKLIFDKKN